MRTVMHGVIDAHDLTREHVVLAVFACGNVCLLKYKELNHELSRGSCFEWDELHRQSSKGVELIERGSAVECFESAQDAGANILCFDNHTEVLQWFSAHLKSLRSDQE